MTVRVTGMLIGEPVAPVEVIVTVPLYVPALNPEVSTLTDTVAGAEPLPGVAESQGALLDAAQESVPPPAFVTDIVWEAGLAPPTCPLNARLPGVSDNTGPGTGPGADEELPEHPAMARRAMHAPSIRKLDIPASRRPVSCQRIR